MWTGQEEIKTQIDALIFCMDVHLFKTEANQEEMMAAIKASQEKIKTLMDVSLEMTEACLEKTEVNQEKVETKLEACLEEFDV